MLSCWMFLWRLWSSGTSYVEPAPAPDVEVQNSFPETLLSDSVYEMYKPENEDDIECEIIFVHGLQMTADKEKLRQAYRKTWLTEDKKECWLQTFLPRAFHNKIRVLSVTYDSAAFTTSDTGRFDLKLTGETLVDSVIKDKEVNVGQRGVPVILVAHSFGGFAIKQMLVHADKQVDSSSEIKSFLKNLQGLFFYSTPHLGSSLAQLQDYLPLCWRGPALEVLRPLSTEGSRLNGKFQFFKERHAIKIMNVFETERLKKLGFISVLPVEEGSARAPEETRPIRADHSSICKPESERSDRFTTLRDFIRECLRSASQQTVAVAQPSSGDQSSAGSN